MAWWVVVGHILYSFSDALGRLSHNRSAVDVFIALSGFVIMFLLDGRRETTPAFLTRRFFRLYPAYLVVLIASVLALGITTDALQGSPFEGARNSERMIYLEAATAQLPQHIAAHLTMLHGLAPASVLEHADLAIVAPAWSISVEWQFYLLAPLVYAGLTSGWPGRALVVAMAVGLFYSKDLLGLGSNDAFIGSHVPWFALGITSFFLWRAKAKRSLLVFAVLSVAAAFVLREIGAIVWAGVLWLLAEGPGSRLANRLLTWPPMKALGDMSYSTYVAHMLPLYLAMWALRGASDVPYVVGVTCLTVLGTFVLSAVMYRYVEKPGMQVGQMLARRQPAPAPAAAPK